MGRQQEIILRWLRVGGTILCAAPLGCAAVAGYVGWKVSHPPRKTVDIAPEVVGLPQRDIDFVSLHQDIRLRGWHIPTQGEQLVIFAHGYAENRTRNKAVLPLAQAFYAAGISSLLFDFRNSGESDASSTSVGHFEKYDLLAAVRWGLEHGYKQLALVGFSMGAAAAIVAAPEAPHVSAVVADSPFSDLEPYLRKNLRIWTGLPNFPFTPLILRMIPPLTGMDTREVRPITKIREFGNRRLLLIHNGEDPMIPVEHSVNLYKQADAERAELWITDGDTHVGSYALDPDTYLRKVVTFVRDSFRHRPAFPGKYDK